VTDCWLCGGEGKKGGDSCQSTLESPWRRGQLADLTFT